MENHKKNGNMIEDNRRRKESELRIWLNMNWICNHHCNEFHNNHFPLDCYSHFIYLLLRYSFLWAQITCVYSWNWLMKNLNIIVHIIISSLVNQEIKHTLIWLNCISRYYVKDVYKITRNWCPVEKGVEGIQSENYDVLKVLFSRVQIKQRG